VLSAIEVSQHKQAYWWMGFLATKIFILLKKIVVDVDKMNDILQFFLMLPRED